MAVTYEPIASVSITSSTATASFTSIPGTFSDLVIAGTIAGVSGGYALMLRINDDTGSNYSMTTVRGTGSAASSTRVSSNTYGYATAGGVSTTQTNFVRVQLMSYANTNVYKTILCEGSVPADMVDRSVNLWQSTSAITKVTFALGGSFPTTNIASANLCLFGVKAA